MMEKQRIIEQSITFLEWVLTLQQVPQQFWITPFKKGSWGPAEVIAHFSFWDKFVIDNRLRPLLLDEEMPSVPVDVQLVNNRAAAYAKKKPPIKIIQNFRENRLLLVSLLDDMPEEIFSQRVGGKDILWNQYFKGLNEHDEKHRQQMEEHLKKFTEVNSENDTIQERKVRKDNRT
jgi:hypothetical protein